jgi:hypothetical protein
MNSSNSGSLIWRTDSNIFDLKAEVDAVLDDKIDVTLANDVNYLIH